MANQTFSNETVETRKVADVLHDISHDVGRIAGGELDLARGKLTTFVEELVLKAAGAVVGATVAFFGLGLLCLTVVAALSGPLPPLWLRLLIMAIVYLAVGGLIAYLFARQLKATRRPDLHVEAETARGTVDAVKKGLAH